MQPWSFLAQFGAPNVDWCEAGLNSWITEPANTWSNLAYVAVALLTWKVSRAFKGSLLRFFAPATLALGIFSGSYHASNTFALQIFDFLGMFLVFLIPLFINLQRLRVNKDWTSDHMYFLTSVLATLSIPFWAGIGFPYQALIGLLAVLIFATEAAIRWKARSPATYRPYVFALVFFGLGAGASAADVTRLLCEPSNHWLQGHAVWHVLTATAIYFCFGFYSKITRDTQA